MDPDIPFPFHPYQIQKTFMKELYRTLEEQMLGIFESPTGTGKSLSICCSALQWLKDSETKTLEDLAKSIEELKIETSINSSSEDWLNEEYEKIKKCQVLALLLAKMDKIKKRNENFEDMKVRVHKKQDVNMESALMVKKYQDQTKSNDNKELNEMDKQSDDNDLLIEEPQEDSDEDEEEEEKSDELDIKIYISSRTHSQLSQFIGEIKRTVYVERGRVVTIASRQHYCINPEVTKLKNINLINERCLDMQKSKSKSSSVDEDGKVLKKAKKNKGCGTCPYYNQSNIRKLKERLLVDVMDMEDLLKCSKYLKGCPYYASRMALDEAKVVLVSHTGIVSPGARSGVSLKLENNVLIMDEAHGLTSALEQAHSAPLSARQLFSVKTYLQFYINKYITRLSSKNLLSLNQMSFVIGKLLATVQNKSSKDSDENSSISTIEEFVIKSEIDHLNLKNLVAVCRCTRLAPKLHGFYMRYDMATLQLESRKTEMPKKSSFKAFLNNISKKKGPEQQPVDDSTAETNIELEKPEISAGSSLYAVLDFLEMLCDRSENGRVLTQTGKELTGNLKYLLLNPAEHFVKIVEKCRSVIVAGGTMEPISEFEALLTGNGTESLRARINTVRCDHVVSPENVLAICLSKGPTNLALNFSYENRKSTAMLDEFGRTLKNICSIVPGGVVCFLPSYSYENIIYEHLKNHKILELIDKKKKIFREPKSSAEVDKVLSNFATAVKSKEAGKNGALLFSVVGGKLSEGLNFSDDLGRCVIVVGMPYPNIKSPELQEKMNYLNSRAGANAGNTYYENLCMKAVNQCIGRAVRHANDYACVLLVDERYSRSQTVSAIPSFVQKSLLTHVNFGITVGSIAKFFSKHKMKV